MNFRLICTWDDVIASFIISSAVGWPTAVGGGIGGIP